MPTQKSPFPNCWLADLGLAIQRAERVAKLKWVGPLPLVLLVADNGRGFNCPDGKCAGRFEAAQLGY